MKGIEQRLKDLKDSKARSTCTESRLYMLDGKIYELENVLRPKPSQRASLEDLKERQQQAEAKQEQRRTWQESEDQQLLTLFAEHLSKPLAEVLKLLYIDAEDPETAARKAYNSPRDFDRRRDEYINCMYQQRARAIRQLQQAGL